MHATPRPELHRARGRGERELELGLGGALGGAWPLQSATSCFFVQTLPVSPPSDMMAAVTPAPKTYKTPARPRRSLKHAQMPSKPFPTPSTHMHMQQPPSTAYRLVGCYCYCYCCCYRPPPICGGPKRAIRLSTSAPGLSSGFFCSTPLRALFQGREPRSPVYPKLALETAGYR